MAEAKDKKEISLAVNVGGLAMINPVMTASGTFGFGFEYAGLVDIDRLGAIVVKGITLKPRTGNPPPRLVETPAGLLNSVGLQNPGSRVFVRDILPRLQKLSVPVVVNIAGETIEEYEELAALLDKASREKNSTSTGAEGAAACGEGGVVSRGGIKALEVNISCPNVKQGGIAFGLNPSSAAKVTAAVRRATKLPVIVKLSPAAPDLVLVAERVLAAGADALSLINTIPGMAIDIYRRRPVLAAVSGGLSGPAIKPLALRMVYEVYRALRAPIIGMGGITSASDALEFIMAGARAVAVGTANFVDPSITLKVIEGIRVFLQQEGVKDINDLVGVAQV